MRMGARIRRRQRGTSLVEFVLLFPVVFFLFVGAFDLGFFCYAFIAVQDAARVAALYTSTSSSTMSNATQACTYVLSELQSMPNYSQLPSTCNAAPLVVTVTAVTGPDNNQASQVTVTYKTLQLIPIPGLPAQVNISRVVEMRVRG